MNHDYWLETNDENYVVLVPHFEGEDIAVLDIRDGDVPDNLKFDLANTLKDAVMEEVREIAADSDLTVREERMAITPRND